MTMTMMHQMLSRTRVLGSSAIGAISGRRGGVQPRALPLLLLALQQQGRARAYSTSSNNSSNNNSNNNNKPKLDQSAMGQSEQGKKNQGRWFIFGIHPFALFAALTLLYSGYNMAIKPTLQDIDLVRHTEDQVKRMRTVEQAAQAAQTQAAQDLPSFTDAEVARFPFGEKEIIFVLGAPGSGKGTNSARLVDDLGFVHLSAGDLLRAEQMREGSQYGRKIAHYIREGLIVPHTVTIRLLQNAIMDHPDKQLFLVDGFPRNVEQAREFEKTVCEPRLVLFFDCPEDVLVARLMERGKTSGRADDNKESIKKRFLTYLFATSPVILDYAKKGKLIRIGSNRPVDEVYGETRQRMVEYMREREAEKEEKE
ncbi:bifunctional uridylate/adenylate kinase [Coemansia sp. RSA 1939]|nr:bifunctional uridylate/adenylate kinase [Coemansia sp. RSA 1939]KAJ2617927.1 bifunctional uridylate/adenylate kinase [Coemansia sp. RSA 1804]KAJ2694023.1 bifunctional uridylate/adenylate kinase [Coemansia sp. RSA 1285]